MNNVGLVMKVQYVRLWNAAQLVWAMDGLFYRTAEPSGVKVGRNYFNPWVPLTNAEIVSVSDHQARVNASSAVASVQTFIFT